MHFMMWMAYYVLLWVGATMLGIWFHPALTASVVMVGMVMVELEFTTSP